MAGFRRKPKIAVEFFDTETLEVKRTEMFMEGYKAGYFSASTGFTLTMRSAMRSLSWLAIFFQNRRYHAW